MIFVYENFMGIINLDENEGNIRELTRNRPLASVPIGGRYRIIDFIMSNMTNSGIENIGIFTKIESRSLIDHISNGRPWDLNRKIEGLRVFNFTDRSPNFDDIYNFAKNMSYFKKSKEEYVIISPSYMVCNVDLDEAMKFHVKSKNDVTIIYKEVKNADTNYIHCETLNIDSSGRVASVGRNIGINSKANICMEMYMMSKSIFMDIVNECISIGSYRKVKCHIYNCLDSLKVGSFRFDGYLSCINSIKEYYRTNMELLKHNVMKELFSSERPIYTKTNDEVPARYSQWSDVKNSIVGNGCFIEGKVENSIISRRVTVSKNAVLENCIVLQNCNIGKGVKLQHVILDKNTSVKNGRELKGDEDMPIVIENQEVY
ncbi:MAG: glucose-1-phosphate adenylyltransferase subunit GlgD [Clostridium sp.]|jgi:glucose-1-phosphate adenylyltransferase|uniref:glucose-1-phosphate adenylyltransferase subunit GlgD n=2 Tax=Clostridium sp. TaxID=1506 RepID=UPI0025B98D31|nr:glucose-1-phosphate adenylyltransferase subunit GlgD [Clostridium sp.]MCI1716913.1 glucose-1-phosphate adenylyltransferase subunit GlgD [Clostridium sp.]MCI1815099.1 glucose-1-phosphate adenylyltransferase subunit GlgD [Clostridium sp.]MCI1872002.1 glucose-1-phosphate adenylyltransferase subunit GlgD [Clostridium sp.]